MNAPWMEYSKMQCRKEAQRFRKEAQSTKYLGLSLSFFKHAHTYIHALTGEKMVISKLKTKHNFFP